jgi:hypothetical protein
VNEKLARKWFREFVAEGAKFEEADFKDVFGWLHGTRDIQTGRWKVGKSGLVTDPRPILENRLCDAMERRLNRAGQLTTGGMAQPSSPGSRAFVLRQQIAALEEQLENHKGNPDGGYAADVKHIHQEAWRVKARELDALKTQLTKINEQPG